MIFRTLRRLFNGHYVSRLRRDASRAAWRLHTDALNTRLERKKQNERDDHEGVERKVKTR
ncbi:MAG: hypothetical protein ACRCWJ_04730 [Casimicrobium sp.]